MKPKSNLVIALLFAIFATVLYLMNYFVVSSLQKIYFLPIDVNFVAFVSFFILITSALLSHNIFNAFGRVLYYIFSFYLGFLWLLFFSALVFRVVVLFYPGAGVFMFPFFAALAIFSTAYAWHIKVRRVHIPAKKKLKVLHLSDMHIGPLLREHFLERVVKITNDLKPDLVCITGDIIDDSRWNVKISKLNELNSPVYAVLGNHDIMNSLDEKLKAMKDTRITVLTDSVHKEKDYTISGAGEESSKVLKKLKKDNFNIFLSHEPMSFSKISRFPVNLHLAGHTHGGQIFPLHIIIKIIYRNFRGLYEKKGQYVHVSQGTGLWGPPMRLLSSNEITLIDIG